MNPGYRPSTTGPPSTTDLSLNISGEERRPTRPDFQPTHNRRPNISMQLLSQPRIITFSNAPTPYNPPNDRLHNYLDRARRTQSPKETLGRTLIEGTER